MDTLVGGAGGEVCHENKIAVCSKHPEVVTVTVKRQPCGLDLEPKVTKMCVTHSNGDWTCQNFTQPMGETCHETNVTKVITTEPTISGVRCNEKLAAPICHRSGCRLGRLNMYYPNMY
jgi:hypothetical protein